MKTHRTSFIAGALAAIVLALGLGCRTQSTPTDDGGLKTAVQAGPKLANAAAQAQKRELAKPAPSVPLLSDLTEIIIASTQAAGVKENELIGKLLAKTVSLKDALLAAERAREDGDAALLAAAKENARLHEELAGVKKELGAAQTSPIFWIVGIVSAVLILGGTTIGVGGTQLGITRAPLIGGSAVGIGLLCIGFVLSLDSILGSAQAGVVLWLGVAFVALLLAAVGYGLWRWVVQGKTLAVAVRETDSLLSDIDPPVAEAFKASAGRAMDEAHKRVVQLARKAGQIGKEVAKSLDSIRSPP